MREQELLSRWDETLALLDAYEPLLSPAQKEILGLYFRFNLSLSEIAEQRGTSRTAIFDAVKQGVHNLNDYEQKLHLAHHDALLAEAIEALEKASTLEEAKSLIPQLKTLINPEY